MWCPNGYATFREIQTSLRTLLRTDAAREKIHEQEKWISESWGQKYLERAEQVVRRECVKEFFSNCATLSIFSPSGICLKIDSRIATYREVMTLGWQYTFIDRQTGIVSGLQLDKCVSEAQRYLPLMRSNIDKDDDVTDFEDNVYYELCGVEDDRELWEVFEKFNGWAVGCEIEDSFMYEGEFLSLDPSTYISAVPILNQSPNLIKYPDLKSQIVYAFDSGFIRSKHSLWKEAFPGETREAFRTAWAEAARERPELSKRGPK